MNSKYRKKKEFLKGPYCNVYTSIKLKFCGKRDRRTFFVIKFQVSIKDKKNNLF